MSESGYSVARLKALTVHEDSRGSVRETYRTSWWPDLPPVKQLVRSQSIPNTLRGMHLHRRQFDLWHFVSGSALVRLVYHDEGIENIFMRLDAGSTLAIPPGVSHGFYTTEGCTLLYALTEEYIPFGEPGCDEWGWYPFDGLTDESHPGWPRNHLGVVVSERDLRATRLDEFEA